MTWYSQAGQDEWVHSIIGDTGFFVDVGAYDGIEHSNTLALEQRGWLGVCIEADQAIAARCDENRSCPVWCARVGFVMPLGHLMWSMRQRTIDYLSIDVEGMDLEVLQGHDFDRWPVRLITVEHNLYLEGPARKDAIYEFLTDRGFERVREDVVAPGYGPYECWYANPALVDL